MRKIKVFKNILFFILISSLNESILAQNKEILAGHVFTQCEYNPDIYYRINRIKSIENVNDTTFVEVEFIDACCNEYSPTIEIKDSIINLKYKKHGDAVCDCSCKYGITYKIINLKKEYKTYLLNNSPIYLSKEKYKTYPIQFDIINGDTINLKNKYGTPVGYWNKYDTVSLEFYDGYWGISDEIYYEPEFFGTYITYYQNGKMKSYQTDSTYVSWDETGKVLEFKKYK